MHHGMACKSSFVPTVTMIWQTRGRHSCLRWLNLVDSFMSIMSVIVMPTQKRTTREQAMHHVGGHGTTRARSCCSLWFLAALASIAPPCKCVLLKKPSHLLMYSVGHRLQLQRAIASHHTVRCVLTRQPISAVSGVALLSSWLAGMN